MNPPKDVIEDMLRDGQRGVFISMICLGVAIAIKRREPIENVQILDPDPAQPISEDERAMIRGVMRESWNEMRHGTPVEIDAAIALYKAHLKAAGYSVLEGYGN